MKSSHQICLELLEQTLQPASYFQLQAAKHRVLVIRDALTADKDACEAGGEAQGCGACEEGSTRKAIFGKEGGGEACGEEGSGKEASSEVEDSSKDSA